MKSLGFLPLYTGRWRTRIRKWPAWSTRSRWRRRRVPRCWRRPGGERTPSVTAPSSCRWARGRAGSWAGDQARRGPPHRHVALCILTFHLFLLTSFSFCLPPSSQSSCLAAKERLSIEKASFIAQLCWGNLSKGENPSPGGNLPAWWVQCPRAKRGLQAVSIDWPFPSVKHIIHLVCVGVFCTFYRWGNCLREIELLTHVHTAT